MRITLLNQFYLPDLAPTAFLASSLMEHRAALGDEVTVIASRGGYVPQSHGRGSDLENGVRVRRTWSPRLGKSNHLFRLIDYLSYFVGAFWRMVFGRRQDLVIAMTTPPLIGLAATVHKWLHPGTKFLLWNMDCYPDALEATDVIKKGGIVSRLLRWLTRVEFRSVDHQVTLDHAMSHLLLSQYVDAGRTLPTSMIPNWEPAALFAEPADTHEWSKAEELGIQDKFTLLFLGNTGYNLRLEPVIEAAIELRNEPVRFLFVGGGKRWREIEEAIEHHQLDNIVLHGYVPKEETRDIMRASDGALITLFDWAVGIASPCKLHSNLAMRLPIVYLGPPGGNVDQAIADHQCGVSLRGGDGKGLVEFIRKCLTDDSHLEDLRRRARNAFDTTYCDLQTLPQFDAIIDSLVPDGRGASVRPDAGKTPSEVAQREAPAASNGSPIIDKRGPSS